ncbi:E3 ubiquitin-protein ligase TRAF7-like [Anneissia japonica]|uniref:E3 ubiquitin-protein ligase TRAF7-like n=1 Tax=Anneissia japonica TaxID=1529436 RepID=UPI0014254D35|nr:E3 ubiquitin-protein ligase TRAF7-like [Anneissia japonica]
MKDILMMASINSKTRPLVEQPSAQLKCPFCRKLLFNPVISTDCGHTFCQACSTTAAKTDGARASAVVCPVDGKPIHPGNLVVNRAIASQIDDLVVYCPRGIKRLTSHDYVPEEGGCPVQLTIANIDEHELQCEYVKLGCPNNEPVCGTFRRNELDEHLRICPYVPCRYAANGCSFLGPSANLEKHETVCDFVEAQESGNWKNTVKELKDENMGLKKTVHELSERVSMLEDERKAMAALLQKCSQSIQSLEEQQQKMQKVDLVRRARNNSTSSISSIGSSHKRRSSASPEHPSSVAREQWFLPFEFKCIGTLRGHTGGVHCLTVKGRTLYSSGADNVIKVWNIEHLSKGCVRTLKGHKGKVTVLIDGGDCLFSASEDKSIRKWSYDDHAMVEILARKEAHPEEITALAITAKYVFSSSYAEIKVWSHETLEAVETLSGLHHRVRALTLDGTKEMLYSGSHNAIHIWDSTGNFALKRKLEHSYGSVYSMALTDLYIIIGKCSSLLFSGTYNRNMHIFDLVSHQHVKSLRGHVGIVTDLSLSPANQFLLSGSFDCTVQIWNLENFLPLQTLSRHEGGVNALALNNGLLFTGSDDKEIKIFKYFKLMTHSGYGNHIKL